MTRPIVAVYQDLAQSTSTPTDPDLNTIIIGPCYDIKDYPDDAAETLLDGAYGALEQPAGGASAYVPPVEGSDAVRVNTYPGQNPGSLVDHESVRVFLQTPRVILGTTQAGQTPSLGSTVATSEADRTLLYFAASDVVARGIRPGDRVVITSSRGTQTAVRTVMTVGEPNADGLATDTTHLRLTQALPTPDTKATGRITAVAGASIVDGEAFVLNDGVNAAVTFQFDSNASVTESATLRAIVFTGTETATVMRDLIRTAINAAPTLAITASVSGTTFVDLVNDAGGEEGNVAITETVTAGGFVVAGMSGGATSSSSWAYNSTGEARVERVLPTQELVDEAHTFITFPEPGFDTLVLKGGLTLPVTLTPVPSVSTPTTTSVTASRSVSYSRLYLAYRALRQDLQEPGKVTIDDVVSAGGVASINGVGRIDARNPLAAGLDIALKNAGSAPVWYLGVTSESADGYTVARAAIEARRDFHCVIPMTLNDDVIASESANVSGIADPDLALTDGVVQKFRVVLGCKALPTAKIVSEGTINGIAQQPGTSTGRYRTVSLSFASSIGVRSVLPGDTVIFGLPSTGAPTGWQNRRGNHLVTHVNNNYTDSNPAYPSNDSVFELEPGTSRWDDTAATAPGDIELVIKSPDGTVKVSKLGTLTVTVNSGNVAWAMRNPTTVGGPYTVTYASGSAAAVSVVGFTITVTYVNGVTTHNDVATLVAAHPVLSGIVTATAGGTATNPINAGSGPTAIEVQSGVCTAEIVVNDNLFDKLEDASATFLTSGVQAGDILEIPLDPNNYSASAFDGRLLTVRVAQILNEQHLLIANGRDDGPSTANELPHYYMRDYAQRTVDNAAPNAIHYRVRRALSKDDQVIALTSYAQGYRNKRVALIFPGEVEVAGLVDGSLPRTTPTVRAPAGWQPGYYAACMVGGALAGLPVHHGLTNLGFAGLTRLRYSSGYFSEPQLTRLSDGGYFVLQQRRPTDLVSCLHQLTTDTTALETGELSVVRTIDFVSLYLQGIAEEYLGQYNVLPETASDMYRAETDGIENLKSRKTAKIGAPVTEGSVTLIKVADFAKDRYQIFSSVKVPGPLNNVDLHVVAGL